MAKKKKRVSKAVENLKEQIIDSNKERAKKKEAKSRAKRKKERSESESTFRDETIAMFKPQTLDKLGGWQSFSASLQAKAYDIMYERVGSVEGLSATEKKEVRNEVYLFAKDYFERKIGKRPKKSATRIAIKRTVLLSVRRVHNILFLREKE